MERNRISKYSEQIRGVSYKPEDIHDDLNDNSITLLRANNISDGNINFDDVVYVDKSKVSKKQILKKGDVLICASSGSKHLVGKAAQINFEGEYTFGAFCKVVRPININNIYIGMYFQSSEYRRIISSVSQGANINNIKNEDIDNLFIKVPNEAEQKNVSEILIKVSQIIMYRKQQLEELDKLIKSRFVEMFGDLAINPLNWKESQLIDLCTSKDDIKCGPFGTQLSKDEYKKEGVPLWGIPQINSFFSIMPTDFISEDKAKKLEAYSIVKDDIVMSRKGNVGKCAIYPADLSMGIMHSDALRIRVNKSKINPVFLIHQLHNSRYVVNQIDNVSSGAIMAGVNVTKLKNIYVHIPPTDLQNQFAVFVQQVDKLKVEVKKSLAETQKLFNSLMQKYFD